MTSLSSSSSSSAACPQPPALQFSIYAHAIALLVNTMIHSALASSFRILGAQLHSVLLVLLASTGSSSSHFMLPAHLCPLSSISFSVRVSNSVSSAASRFAALSRPCPRPDTDLVGLVLCACRSVASRLPDIR